MAVVVIIAVVEIREKESTFARRIEIKDLE